MPISAAFDSKAVDFLKELDVSSIKIASFECIDVPLIEKAAKTGLPLIISTGMAGLDEISEAVTAARGLIRLTSLCPSPQPTSRTVFSFRWRTISAASW